MLEWALEQFVALLGPISTARREKREVADNALRAISIALNETYIYYRSIEAGRARNLETEAQLSRYWAAAAIPVRHIDSQLAQTCEYKGEYWVNPDNWDHERIETLGIALDDVRCKYRAQLWPNLRFNSDASAAARSRRR